MIPDPTDGSDGTSSRQPKLKETWETAPSDPPPREHGTSQEISKTEGGEKRLIIHDPSISYSCWVDADSDTVLELENML